MKYAIFNTKVSQSSQGVLRVLRAFFVSFVVKREKNQRDAEYRKNFIRPV